MIPSSISATAPGQKTSAALGMWDRLLDDDVWYIGLGTIGIERQEKYRQWIDSQIEKREWEEIRQATQRGRLIGREIVSETGGSDDGAPFSRRSAGTTGSDYD